MFGNPEDRIHILSTDYTVGDPRFLTVTRDIGGVIHTNVMPRETLAIRAAEYDLDPHDPLALDIVLLEDFHIGHDDVHPLFSTKSVESARIIMADRIEAIRERKGAPTGRNRMMADAVANGAASVGLVDFHRFSHVHVPEVDPAVVAFLRELSRHKAAARSEPTTLAQKMNAQARLAQQN